MREALERIRRAAETRERLFLSTPNLNFLVAASRDRAFHRSLLSSDLNVADGMPLLWIAKLLRIPLPERVAGSDLFEELCREGIGRPLRVFFFGGAEGVAEAACRRLNARDCAAVCVGHADPGVGPVESLSRDEQIAQINASGADFLVVALGAVKGQAWIERNLSRLEVPVVSHLGAVVNFAAGRVRRAPPWMRRSGLEWAWRIREEPELWRRYVSDGAALVRLVATRVIPLALALRRGSPDGDELSRATCEVEESAGSVTVRLRGSWTQGNLPRLRGCFLRALEARKPIRLDLSATRFADLAVLGLIQLLEAACQRLRLGFRVEAENPRVNRLLRLACTKYLTAD